MVPDEDASGRELAPKLEKLKMSLERCETERREYLDGWQRAKADLINYKKDETKRFQEFARFATEEVVADVVHVLDSFDLALQHGVPKDVERGIILIRSQLEDVLRRRGLEVMQSKGLAFDPSLHESVGEIETDGPEEVVAEELQRGYLLNGKVLRPARVKISKRK